MSQENIDATYRGLEAFNERDYDGYVALMTEDVEADSRLATMEGAFHGHDGIRRWLDSIFNTWPDVIASIGEAQDLGDVRLYSLTMRGRGAGSDVPLESKIWQVARWRGDKVCWWASFNTRDEARAAVADE